MCRIRDPTFGVSLFDVNLCSFWRGRKFLFFFFSLNINSYDLLLLLEFFQLVRTLVDVSDFLGLPILGTCYVNATLSPGSLCFTKKSVFFFIISVEPNPHRNLFGTDCLPPSFFLWLTEFEPERNQYAYLAGCRPRRVSA